MTNTTDITAPEVAVIGLADGSDIFASVTHDDLTALLEVAQQQMDTVTEEEAEGYGLTAEQCATLYSVASGLLADLGFQ